MSTTADCIAGWSNTRVAFAFGSEYPTADAASVLLLVLTYTFNAVCQRCVSVSAGRFRGKGRASHQRGGCRLSPRSESKYADEAARRAAVIHKFSTKSWWAVQGSNRPDLTSCARLHLLTQTVNAQKGTNRQESCHELSRIIGADLVSAVATVCLYLITSVYSQHGVRF